MNSLLALSDALYQYLLADAQQSLALLGACFDPFDAELEDDESPERIGLGIAREHLPEAYAELMLALQAGLPFECLEGRLCAAFRQTGIPLESLDLLPYGIPLPAYGLDLDDPEWLMEQTELCDLFAWFGADVGEGLFPESASACAQVVSQALIGHAAPTAQQVGWCVAWLWGITGNSCLDLSAQALDEYEPLRWEADDIAFARELIAEAESLMAHAQAGLQAVHEHPPLQTALKQLIRQAQTLVERATQTGESLTHAVLGQLAQQLRVDGTAFAGGAD